MSDSREREVSKYLLKFSKEATDDAIQYSIKQLKAHSFFVDTNHIDDERIIIVSPSSTQIAQTVSKLVEHMSIACRSYATSPQPGRKGRTYQAT